MQRDVRATAALCWGMLGLLACLLCVGMHIAGVLLIGVAMFT